MRLRINSVKPEQLDLQISYTSVTLCQYCLAIIHQIEKVQRHSRLKYIKEILTHLSDRQKILLSDAIGSYELRKAAFEREKEFLSGLTIHFSGGARRIGYADEVEMLQERIKKIESELGIGVSD